LGLHCHKLITFDSDWYQKCGDGFENSLGPFALHDASKSNLVVLAKIGHARYFISFYWELAIKVAHASCWPHFFEHSQSTWLGFSHYKQRLFVCWCWFTFSMGALNCVLLIFMGSSIDKVAKGWGGMIGTKLCCVMDVNSQHLFCWCLKSWLSHQTTCAMVKLKVEGFGMVNNKLSHHCVAQIEIGF
jgi:hypothetical protein